MDNYHITNDGERWKFKKAGSSRALITAASKKEIIVEMRVYMRNRTGSVKIHKTDGKIQEERTYLRRADPKRSRG